MWQKRWRESSTTDSTTWRKPGTACALNKQDSVKIDHVRTRSCASRSRSVTDTRLPSQRRPSWPSLTTPRHLAVSGGRTRLSEQPWLAPTRLDQLERCQNRALRIITGQLKTTPLEVAVAYENTHRLPTNHPRRTPLEEPCRHRLKRPSWRSTAKALTNRLPDALSSRGALQALLECPWATKAQWKVFTEFKLAPTDPPPKHD